MNDLLTTQPLLVGDVVRAIVQAMADAPVGAEIEIRIGELADGDGGAAVVVRIEDDYFALLAADARKLAAILAKAEPGGNFFMLGEGLGEAADAAEAAYRKGLS